MIRIRFQNFHNPTDLGVDPGVSNVLLIRNFVGIPVIFFGDTFCELEADRNSRGSIGVGKGMVGILYKLFTPPIVLVSVI